MASARIDQESVRPAEDAMRVFPGDSELARLCRSHDWTGTGLGPVEEWPDALRSIVRTCLESPFPINLWCGPDLNLIYNDAYRRVLGDKHPDALGRPGNEVWAEIWPEIHQMFEGIRAGGPPTFAEDQQFLMQRSGEPAEAWFTYSVSPVRTDSGDIVAFLNVASETTNRVLAERALELARADAERAQERLQQAFEQAPVAVCVLRGAEHTFEVVNPGYQRFFPGRALQGLPIRDALPELQGQGVYELLEEVRNTGVPYIGREFRIHVDRSGGGLMEERVFNFVYQPVRDAEATDAIVVVATDVTELVEARRSAEAAQRAAEDANAAKAQFLAMMSHELRTPLNAIGGYAQLLELGVHGPVTPAQREALARLQASQQHLLGLISAVLNFARLEAGHVEYARELVRIADVVREAETLIAVQARAMRHTVEVRAASSAADEVMARGDHEKIRQIVINLLSNAVKFTEPGGRIAVKYGRLHGEARIEVSDTGRGIPADQLPRVFEPFVQVGRSYSSQAEGTGLGLAISRDLARGMGGDLVATSAPGAGSTFTLILPLGETD